MINVRTPQSIFEIKQTARKTLQQQPQSILKLGWAPVLLLMGIIYLAMRWVMNFAAQLPSTATYDQIYTAMTKLLANNPQIYQQIFWYSVEARLAYFLVFTGVTFTCLDLVRQPQQSLGWSGAWQLFSSRYFFATISLWLVIFAISQLGFWLPAFLGLLVMLFVRYGFVMTYFIYKDLTRKQKLAWRQIWQTLRLSWRLMRGHKLRFFFLDFSFLGWDLLNYFSWGVVNLYVAPYKAASYAAFYQDLLRLYEGKIIIK